MPIQVNVTHSREQLVCHIGWSPGTLLRGSGIVVLQVSRPRGEVVVGQNPVDLLPDKTTHDVVQTEVAMEDSRVIVKPTMDWSGISR